MAVILFVVGCSWKIWQQYCLWWGVPGKYGSNTDCGGVFLENQYYCHIFQEHPTPISITAIFSRKTPPQSVLLPYFPRTPHPNQYYCHISRNVPPQSVLLPYFPGKPHHNQYYCHIFQKTPPQSVLLPYFPGTPHPSQYYPTTISITAVFSRNTPPQSVLLTYLPGTPPPQSVLLPYFQEHPPQSALLPYFPGKPHHNQCYCHISRNVPPQYGSNTDCGGVFWKIWQ